ncbi:MAG: transposase [Phycisphaerae bacterium]
MRHVLALTSHPALVKFAEMLERHQYGIIHHDTHEIHPGKRERVSNKIQVMERIADGFRDPESFAIRPGRPYRGVSGVTERAENHTITWRPSWGIPLATTTKRGSPDTAHRRGGRPRQVKWNCVDARIQEEVNAAGHA